MSDRLIDGETLERPVEIMPMQWLTVVFDKAGKSYRGNRRFVTFEAAQGEARDIEQWAKDNRPGILGSADGQLDTEDFHYAIPMPELL